MELKNKFSVIWGSDDRTRKASMNSLIMFFCKACTVIINLLYVPLLIDAMSQSNYGIWLTLSSIVSWLFVFDVGIGHGVRNRVSEALAEGKTSEARGIISTGYCVLFVIISFLFLVIFSLFPHISWSSVLSAPKCMNEELTFLTMVVVSSFCFQLLLKLIDAVLYAFQTPAIVSGIVVFHQGLGMLIIYLMKTSGLTFSLFDYGLVISLTPTIIILLFTIAYFMFYKPDLSPSISSFSKKYVKDVLNLGVRFFAIQLTAVFLFQSNSIIIAHQVDSLAVVDYNVAYKYFGVLLMIFTTITAPIWSASTEAFTKGDYDWIKKTYKHLNRLYYYAIIAGFFMLICSPIAYKIWLHKAVPVNWTFMAIMFFYYILNIRTSIYASFINGSGKISLQFYITAIECIIHIPLAIILCKFIGVGGVVVSLTLITIINLIWEPIQLKKLTTGTAHGIWNK